MVSEGGTSEELRTDPHLKFSSVVHKVVKNRKNWSKSSLRFPDPHLDKIRSALTGHGHQLFNPWPFFRKSTIPILVVCTVFLLRIRKILDYVELI